MPKSKPEFIDQKEKSKLRHEILDPSLVRRAAALVPFSWPAPGPNPPLEQATGSDQERSPRSHQGEAAGARGILAEAKAQELQQVHERSVPELRIAVLED